ncbi:MAG TPA: hypothetical protein VJB11_00080 [archaeon]|nr:hypothetical protein [archaeon]
MKLRCSKCGHTWVTRKDKVPVACPYCKSSTYYKKPLVLRE